MIIRLYVCIIRIICINFILYLLSMRGFVWLQPPRVCQFASGQNYYCPVLISMYIILNYRYSTRATPRSEKKRRCVWCCDAIFTAAFFYKSIIFNTIR